MRQRVAGDQKLHGPCFGAAHCAFLGGLEVVVAGEVEPAVDEVQYEFGGEIPARADLADRGVNRDADFAGGALCRVAFEGDDVGGSRVGEEVGVKLGEGGVSQENEGELAGWNFRISILDLRLGGTGLVTATCGKKFGVEGVNYTGHGAAIQAQAGVAVSDEDFAMGHAEPEFFSREWTRMNAKSD